MCKKLFYYSLNVLFFIQSLYCAPPIIIEPGERHVLLNIKQLMYLYKTLSVTEKMYLFNNGCIVSPYMKALMEYSGVDAFKKIVMECPDKKDLRLYKKEGILHKLFHIVFNRSFSKRSELYTRLPEIVDFALGNDLVDVTTVIGENRDTALHVLCAESYQDQFSVNIAKLLVESGASTRARNSKSQTPFVVLIQKIIDNIVRRERMLPALELVSYFVSTDTRGCKEDMDKHDLVYKVILINNANMLDLLLRVNPRLDLFHDYQTIVHICAMLGAKSCLDVILSNADQQGISNIINIKNQVGYCPLDVAQESMKEYIQYRGGIHSSGYENEMKKAFFSACNTLLYDTSDDEN